MEQLQQPHQPSTPIDSISTVLDSLNLQENNTAKHQPTEKKEHIQPNKEANQRKESVLMDFSNTFKQGTRGFKKKPVKKVKKAEDEEMKEQTSAINDEGANKDLEDANMVVETGSQAVIEIPRNVSITQEQMAKRKQMDLRRWYCMARPQHPKSCGISSLTSCWNFLFSTLGAGSMPPISTEQALEVLGFNPPYSNFDFGSFTGNDTLIQWFALLNKFYKVKGKAEILWKPKGKSQAHADYDQYKAHDLLIDGLRNEKKAYIYHCWNHYFCPLGFDITPKQPYDAYQDLSDEVLKTQYQTDTWIIIGEISKCYPAFHTKKWCDIVTDLNTQFPEFFNIRKNELGVQLKTTEAFQEGGTKAGGNLHCIIEFEAEGVV